MHAGAISDPVRDKPRRSGRGRSAPTAQPFDGVVVGHGNGGWVATGDGSPAAPTDPDVRDGRIRLLDVAKLRGVHTVNHACRLERVTLEQAVELGPVQLRRSGSAAEPLPPAALDLKAQTLQRLDVPSDAKVGIMAAKLAVQHRPLFRHRKVAVAAAPLVETTQGPGEPGPGRLALHHPVALPGAPPMVGEAEHVKAAFPLRPLRPPVGSAEVHQARLFRVQYAYSTASRPPIPGQSGH